MNKFVRAAVSLSLALYSILSIPFFVLAALLLAHAETSQGRLFAVAVLVGLPVPIFLCVAPYWKRKRGVLLTAAVCGVLSLVLLGIDYALTPNGCSLPGSSARSCFTGTTAYHRLSMANMVPEIDQLVLGTYVVPTMDSLMDETNTAELRNQIHEVYGEMRQSSAFESLGSVLNHTYRDIFLGDRPIGHFYEYLPSATGQNRMPVVLFLHGSLGNLKGYLWVWKHIADKHGFAVVVPTFGTGNWDQPGGMETIERARQYCAAHPRVDPARIYLAGLSNGGLGVCLAASRCPNAYRGLAFISPVMDLERFLTEPVVEAWKDRPVLVLHGTADNRIPVSFVRQATQSMMQKGVRVDCQFYDGQTHFLFFVKRDELRDRIGNWIRDD